MSGYKSTVVARSMPFDNTSNGYFSTNVQDAIIESLNTSIARARFTILAAYNASANTGRWLEWFQSVESQSNPFVFPRDSVITELSLSVSTTATTTITLYKNTIAVQTISLTGQLFATLKLLTIVFNEGDKLSVQVTAGSCTKPSLFIFSELS